jgi:hypothetical protein
MSDLERAKPAFDRTTGAALGFFVGLGATPLLGPILGPLVGNMSAPLIEEVSYALRAMLEKRRIRVELAMRTACEEVNCSAEELAIIALRDDRRIELLVRALEAAATSEEERKVRALGRAMALGIMTDDDAKADEYLRMTTTLAQLEPIDARVLEIMAKPGSKWFKRSGGHAPAVTDAIPGASVVIDAVFARLSGLGLITDASAEHGIILGGAPWSITKFGESCVEALFLIGRSELDADHNNPVDG